MAADSSALLLLDSCHSTWMFDGARHRFRRLVKLAGGASVSTMWRGYDRLVLEPDSEAFSVVLDEAAGRLLQSWRHIEDRCRRCGAIGDTGVSSVDLAHALVL
ncbi:MAG: hypothetical protein JWO62_3601 [Acidimicrobiaceae bacterium]|nr:hypothetical protein [Acidimicrobiaceae bacterium]